MTTATSRSTVAAAPRHRARGWKRFFHENGLSIVVLTTFLIILAAQSIAGLYAYNAERREHAQPAVSFRHYLTSGHFLEAVGENWESEFLQMAAFVWLTSFLFQKGSPESRDPYEPKETQALTKDSPWPARRGGVVRKLYENSLSIAFLLMFIVSFLLHAYGGAREHSREQALHGEAPVSVIRYIGTSQFWFESFENWQSEFLAIGAMVVLGIYLRQKGSPESKAVETPHHDNE